MVSSQRLPLGHLLALHVTPADVGDRAAVGRLCADIQDATGAEVQLGYVDQGYTGDAAAEAAAVEGIALHVVKLPEAKRGFVLLPRRWARIIAGGCGTVTQACHTPAERAACEWRVVVTLCIEEAWSTGGEPASCRNVWPKPIPTSRCPRSSASGLPLHPRGFLSEGSSYRLRQHAELMPEHVRCKAVIAPPLSAPVQRRRGRPPKNWPGTPWRLIRESEEFHFGGSEEISGGVGKGSAKTADLRG